MVKMTRLTHIDCHRLNLPALAAQHLCRSNPREGRDAQGIGGDDAMLDGIASDAAQTISAHIRQVLAARSA